MTSSNRLSSIDVLRGVSLLGILVMNIQTFANPHVAYFNPSAYGSLEGLNGLSFGISRLVFDFKFITLFSTLFGASLLLAGEASNPRRRLVWLIVFGCVHGYLIWFGDVLFSYGVVGLLVLPARGWSARRLTVAGLSLLLLSSAFALAGALFVDALPASLSQGIFRHYDPALVPAELAAFRGSWLQSMPLRASISFDNQTTGLLFETGARVAGCMLIGMAAVKARVFEGSLRWWPQGFIGLLIGFGVTGAGLWLQWSSNFDFRTWLLAQSLHELGSIGLAFGIGLGVVRLALRFPNALFTQAIGQLGRVAFTAYLMHSVVGTLVFGGHGLGLFGTWDRFSLLLAPFAVWSAQLALAWWWTRRYRVGPLEALWRGLSRGDFSLGRAEPTRR